MEDEHEKTQNTKLQSIQMEAKTNKGEAPSVTTTTIPQKQPKGHCRSSSLENGNSFLSSVVLSSKSAMLPASVGAGFSGTLKSRREQKRISDYLSRSQSQDLTNVNTRRKHFENIREIFENSSEKTDEQPKNPQKYQQTTCISQDATNLELTPPKIQSYSGVLSNSKSPQEIIRPIAFKPVPYQKQNTRLTNDLYERYGSTPSLLPTISPQHVFGSANDLNENIYNNYGMLYRKHQLQQQRSQLSSKHSHSSSSSSTVPFKTYDSLESILRLPDTVTPTQVMNINKSTSIFQHHPDFNNMAPSPSDSGISELEAALRDRDSELAYLRQTMEHNEQIIFKVHQDKERHWDQELKRLKSLHESRLKAGALKIHKLEQLLMMQTFQLREDKKKLVEDIDRLQKQNNSLREQNTRQKTELSETKLSEKGLKETNSDLTEEIQMLRRVISDLKGKLEDNEWSLCQRNGEISLLKAQITEYQNEIHVKDREIIRLNINLQIFNDNLETYSNTKMNINYKDRNEGISPGCYMHSSNNNKINYFNGSTGTTTSPCTTSSNELDHSSNTPNPDSYSETSNAKILNNLNKFTNNKRAFLTSQIEGYDSPESLHRYNLQEAPYVDSSNLTYSVAEDGIENIYVQSSEDDFKSLSPSEDLLIITPAASAKIHTTEDGKSINEVTRLTTELELSKKRFEQEKQRWLEEKEKVLAYQRELQKKYLEVMKHTQELEKKLEES